MDADNHDLVSRFYGFFESSVRGSGLIGTLRVSGEEPGLTVETLRKILENQPRLLERLLHPRVHALPMMKYLIDREAVAALVKIIRARGETVVEPAD